MKRLLLTITFIGGMIFSLSAKKTEPVVVVPDSSLTVEQEQQFKYYFYEAIESFLYRDYAKATSLFLFCENLSPKDATVKMYLGLIYKATGQVEMALNYFRKAYEYNPNEYWFIYARVLVEQKDLSTAFAVAEKQHTLTPKDLNVISFLQKQYLVTNDFEKALKLQNEVDAVMGALSLYSVQNKIQILQKAGNEHDAEVILDKYLDENPDDSKMLNMRGDMYWKNGEEVEALRYYEKTESWGTIAQHYMDSARYMEARAMWEREVAQRPNNVGAWIKLFETLQKDTTSTLDEKKDVVIRGYNEIENPQWSCYMVGVLLDEERLDSAIVVARHGRDLPGEVEYRIALGEQLGDLYSQKKQYDSAFVAYQWVLDLSPEDVYICNNYAYLLALYGNDLKKAEELSQKTIKKEPNNAIYLDTYAWIMHLQGESVFAEHYISRALEIAQQEKMSAEEIQEIQDHYDVIFHRAKKK